MKTIIDRFDTPIHHQQIRALFQQSPFMFVGILGVMVVVVTFFWNRVDQQLLTAWALINLSLTIGRLILVKSFYRVKPQGTTLVKWGLVFVMSATFSGIIWGMIAFLFMDPNDVMGVLVVAVTLTGMTSGALAGLSVFLPAFLGFSVPTLSLLAVALLTQAEGVFVLIGYMLVVFAVANLGFSVVSNRSTSESIRLRFENLTLLEKFKRQKHIAETANADKSRFLAATSHDLRQPLHAMDLYLGALKNLLTDKEQIQLLKKGRQSSVALNELLTALMDVSRLDAGDIHVNRTVFDIATLLKTIRDEHQKQASQTGMSIEVQATKLLVDSDTLMLSRMLRNLVANACAHSKGSNILLKAKQLEQQILVSVCDDGVGIPAQDQQQIFSEFYQLKNPERDRSKGLGLGLAIVKRLANLLHHDIQLESAIGKGSCFKLYLPLADDAASLEMASTNQPQLDVAGLFVILVDDEIEIRNAMRTLLLQWGCELLVADGLHSLQQELDALDYPTPDVLLCDYRLRENQTGLAVVDAMRKHFNAKIPALIISGDTDRQVEEKVIKHGCEFLYKPVQPVALCSAIFKLARPGVSAY